MATGHELVQSAVKFRGQPYSMGPGRTTPSSGVKDCSGLIYSALLGVGVNPGGNSVSTTLETWAVRNGGRYVDRDYALHHAGVGLAIWGLGARGHIGISVGDGHRAFETPSSEGRKVGFSSFDRNRWGEFFTWPGIDHGAPTGGPLPTVQPIKKQRGFPVLKRVVPKGTVFAVSPRSAVHLDPTEWGVVAYQMGGAKTDDISVLHFEQLCQSLQVPADQYRSLI